MTMMRYYCSLDDFYTLLGSYFFGGYTAVKRKPLNKYINILQLRFNSIDYCIILILRITNIIHI